MNDTTNLPPLPEPVDYFYEWATDSGFHRSFSSWPWNGVKPEKAVAIYTAAQVEDIHRTAILAERESAADLVLRELGDTGQAQSIAAAIREGDK